MIPVYALPALADGEVYSGTCGENAVWSLDTTTGVLNITGSGLIIGYKSIDMYPYATSGDPDWLVYADQITSVVIEEGITGIGSSAFEDLVNLESVTLSSTVAQIGLNSFNNCPSISYALFNGSDKQWNNIYRADGNDALFDIITVAHITQFSGVCGDNVSWTLDGENGYLGISGSGDMYDYTAEDPAPWYDQRDLIKNIGLGNNVTSVGDYAFKDCRNIEEATAQAALSRIGTGAFENAVVGRFWFGGSDAEWNEIDIEEGNEAIIGIVHCQNLTLNSGWCGRNLTWEYDADTRTLTISGYGPMSDSQYNSDTPWSHLSSQIEHVVLSDQMTTIGGYAFYGMQMSEIEIPDSVTEIHQNAFNYCTKLVTVDVPASVTSIGDNVFYYLDSLTSVTVNGEITEIGEASFAYNKNLTSVVLPDSVTSIGNYAFNRCKKLDTVNIPSSLESVGNYAFAETALENVVLPDTVTTIGDYAFSGCKSLGSVDLPSGLTVIPQYTFQNCEVLSSVVMPDAPETIGFGAFAGCKALGAIDLPGTLTFIGGNAFSGCTSLDGVELPAGLTTLQSGAFMNCSSLTSISIPSGVKAIESSTFSGCTSLSDVELPDSITLIGNSAFRNCAFLREFEIPFGVRQLGARAFEGCTRLASVTIPYTVAIISGESNYFGNVTYNVFSGCTSLADVYYGGNETKWQLISDKLTLPDGVTLHFNDEYVPGNDIVSGTCGADAVWNLDLDTAALTISGSGEIDNYQAYQNYSGGMIYTYYDTPWYSYASLIRHIVIGDGITKIGNCAFSDIYPISVSVGDSLTSLTNMNISKNKLESITVSPDNDYLCAVNDILYDKEMTSIIIYPLNKTATEITIPEGVVNISNAFAGNKYLVTVNVPSTVTNITGAFSGCSSLKNVNIPDAVTYIGDSTFSGCGIETITIPDSVVRIGMSAFSGCNSLTTLNLGKGVKAFGYAAFQYVNNDQPIVVNFAGSFSDWNAIDFNVNNDAVAFGNVNFAILDDYTGSCGENAQFSLDVYGNLRIYGTGTINRFEHNDFWRSFVKTVTVEEGITAIPDEQFYIYYNLESVTLPSTVASIGVRAFSSCMRLVSFDIPESGLVSIGQQAFTGSSSLASIDLPETLETLGAQAFNGCTSLGSIVIPDSVTALSNGLFYGCTALTSVTIPDTLETIEYGGFIYCSSLAHIDLPDGLKTIDQAAFENCTALESIEIPESVDTLGSDCFHGCTSLTEITIPGNLTDIPYGSFEACTALEIVRIPVSVTNISLRAFYQSTAITDVYYEGTEEQWAQISIDRYNDTLTSAKIHYNEYSNVVTGTCGDALVWKLNLDTGVLTISGTGDMYDYNSSYIFAGMEVIYSTDAPWFEYKNDIVAVNIADGVTGIGNNAFTFCPNIESINIGKDVEAFNTGCCVTCDSLAAVNVDNANANIASADGAVYNKAMTELKFYPGAKADESFTIPAGVTTVAASAFANNLILKELVVTSDVVSTGAYAFSGCKALQNVSLNCGSIGDYAFASCGKLESAVLGANVASIGEYAFSNCFKLASVNIPDGITVLNPGVFQNCYELTSISIPSGVVGFGNSLFDGCAKLATIEGYGNVTSYGSDVFSGCKALESYDIPYGTTAIPFGMFKGCTSLSSVTIPESVESVGFWAFNGCTALSYIEVPESVDVIENYAFAGSGLVNVKLPETIESFGSGMFEMCESLESVTVPEGVEDIGGYTFFKCYALETVDLPESLKTISGGSCFTYCTSLKNVNFGSNVESIAVNAFSGCTALESIVIPEKVTAIKSWTFGNCSSLREVTIPAGVTSIEGFAFYNTALTDVYFGGTESQWNAIAISDDNNDPLFAATVHFAEDPEPEITIVKVKAYDVKLTGLDPELAYIIRYATGEYDNVSAIKNGTNAGFMQVSGVTEAYITLPTHGDHTIAAVSGGATVFLDTVEIDFEDMEKELVVSADDLIVSVENLYGASQIRVIKDGNVILKVNPAQFLSDGLKYRSEFTAPASGTYTIMVIFSSGARISTDIALTAPAASISTSGRIFTVSDFGGAGNVSYMRLAKGVYDTTTAIKAAEDLRTYGGTKYFKGETAAFAALDAEVGDIYTVQIGYASGYYEFINFTLEPTVPVITTGSGSITIENAMTDDYYIDWVRCAPGQLDSLYAIRHAVGSQVKKTKNISGGKLTFSGLSAGTYTLYYLYDSANLSEGMITVTVD
ncbi:MAG: leucine-rich repeat protein [Clostridia bacterium]|nr:leucine-rich repeat protein [Clostridia bacterium]